MLNDLLGALWRQSPKLLRRWTVRFSHPRFAVSAGAVVTDQNGRVLLLKHRFRPGSGWGMPGGFLEKGEQPEEALRRELREEVGLEVGEIKLFATRAYERVQQVELVFVCQAIGDTGQFSFEIQEAAWFSPGEYPEELPRDQARLINRALTDGAS